MANGWGKFAQYALDALKKPQTQKPQYAPYLPQATQADMGQAENAPALQAPAIVPRGTSSVSQNVPRETSSQNVPRGTSALKNVPRGTSFAARAPQGDLEAIRALWDKQQADVDKTRADADEFEAKPQDPDLSFLAGLVKAWGGKEGQEAASQYERPMNAQEKAQMLAKLRGTADATEQGLAKDRAQILLGGDKNDIGYIARILAAQKSGQPDWHTDRQIQAATDSIHRSPNLKIYTDYANRVAEGQLLLNQPGVTVMEANEVLQNLSNAIGRTSTSSDYRQKQLEQKTMSEMLSKLKTLIKSDPNQPAPPEVVKLYKRVGSRILDTFDMSIKREAKRAGMGKNFSQPMVNDAVKQAVDHYTSGRYIDELRTTYGLEKSHLTFGERPVSKPAAFSDEDWNALNDEQKKRASDHLNGAK